MMLKKLFGKKEIAEMEEIFSPLDGEILSLEEVPDPVFSQKMIGEGIAIIPRNGIVVSPVNGKIVNVFPTKHAIGILSNNGLEILIHFGLETVALNGEGFEALVKNNQTVKAGDALLNVNLEVLEKNNKNLVTPIIITNKEKLKSIEPVENLEVTRGESIFKCHLN